MNFSQLCRIVGNNRLSDLSMSVRLIEIINRELPEDIRIDIDMTGNEALDWFENLEGYQSYKVMISSQRLSHVEAQELRAELATLEEQLRAIETTDHQIKHNLVMIYITLAVALGAGCIFTYLSTQGVDVETSSQILLAAKQLIVFLLDQPIE